MRVIAGSLLAGLLALSCLTPALAQSTATLPVKSGSGSTVTIAGQNDASGNYHYRDIMEGVDGSGNPRAIATDTSGNLLSLPLPTGAATSAAQTTASGYLSTLATASASQATAANQATSIGYLTTLAGIVSASKAVVTDANNSAFQGAVAMTVGTTYTAQRSLGANCTAAGNITVTFTDASSLTVPVAVGWQTFPFAVTAVSSATATCTYSNLK